MAEQRAHCNICHREFPVPREGQLVLDTELGRHFFQDHPEAIEMAQGLGELLDYQGVLDE